MRLRFVVPILMVSAAAPAPVLAQDFLGGFQRSDDSPFGGLYVGAEVGFDSFEFDGTAFSASEDGDVDFFGFDNEFNGANFNGIIGLNLAFDNAFLIGVEGSIGFTTASEPFDDDDFDDIDEFDEVDDVEGDFTYAVDGNIGYIFGDHLLVFGTIGFGGVDFNDGFDDEFEHGIRFGGGVQYAFTESFSARFRYIRNPLFEDDQDEGDFGPLQAATELNRNQFNAALIFTF
ncbi:MAG: outer membrane protein [Rhodothalassiaceae bacterium]